MEQALHCEGADDAWALKSARTTAASAIITLGRIFTRIDLLS